MNLNIYLYISNQSETEHDITYLLSLRRSFQSTYEKVKLEKR